MGKTKRRAAVVLAGMLVCLLVLEAALRIVGYIYAFRSESSNRSNPAAKSTILCIGDSVTFGIGAPEHLSYSAQLERLLNDSDPENTYAVINRGRPGQNSTQLLMRLEGYLNEFKPDIVTILIGAQNQANFYGYRQYLEKTDNQGSRFFLGIRDALDKIRVFKFFRLMFREKQKQLDHREDPELNQPTLNPAEMEYQNVSDCLIGQTDKGKGDYDKALSFLLDVVEKKDISPECYRTIGDIYREQKQYDQAITWFKKGIERYPTQFSYYEGIGWSYYDQQQFEEAIRWFKEGFEQAAYNTLYELCYVGIAVSFEESKNFQEAVEFFEKETKRKPLVEDYLHTLANDYLMMFKKNMSKKEVYSWIQADIEQILDLCEQYNAQAVLQNYPFEPDIEFIYRQVARQNKIPFVDQQTAFEPHIEDGVHSEEYFVPDGHPNARGYHLMAKNIWKVLKDDVL